MEVDTELLKVEVDEYVKLKTDLKKMVDRKNQLEKNICSAMEKLDVDTLELPDGSNLNYKVRETSSLVKNKAPKEKEKRTKKENKKDKVIFA